MPRKDKKLAKLEAAYKAADLERQRLQAMMYRAHRNLESAQEALADYVCRKTYGWGLGDVIEYPRRATPLDVGNGDDPKGSEMMVVHTIGTDQDLKVYSVHGSYVKKGYEISKRKAHLYAFTSDKRLAECRLVMTAQDFQAKLAERAEGKIK